MTPWPALWLLAQAAAPATPPPQPDVVVTARALKRIRLHYATDGRALRWCHADLSSGSKDVDRISCEVIRMCVAKGADDNERALACFHRWQDRLIAEADRERDARYAAEQAK